MTQPAAGVIPAHHRALFAYRTSRRIEPVAGIGVPDLAVIPVCASTAFRPIVGASRTNRPRATVNKERLTAFSDGVIAIIITIMVLELNPPTGTNWAALLAMLPTFLSYVLSFTFAAIYWNNHHHMLHTVRRVNGAILWANMHLLFWLSLTPFVTAWIGRNYQAPVPTAVYGIVLLLAAIAYYILQSVIIRAEGPDSALATAVGRDIKGKISPVLYAAAICLAFVNPAVSDALYAGVALIWFIPDRRIERRMTFTAPQD